MWMPFPSPADVVDGEYQQLREQVIQEIKTTGGIEKRIAAEDEIMKTTITAWLTRLCEEARNAGWEASYVHDQEIVPLSPPIDPDSEPGVAMYRRMTVFTLSISINKQKKNKKKRYFRVF
jgi:hypothetical protein